jgi:acetyl esterase/lipase
MEAMSRGRRDAGKLADVDYAIDPELLPMLEFLPPRDFNDVQQSRAATAALVGPMNASVDTAGVTIVDHQIPGADGAPPVPVRVYAPGERAPAGGRPALLDIHGGGFASGSIEMEHAFGVRVARDLGVMVAAVEYRLAPEDPFPAGLDDCYAALCWLHDDAAVLGIDTARVGVGGQSAGGGLTAATVLLARDRGGPPVCFQFLGIPELDHRLETASMRAFVDTPIWNRTNAITSWRFYLGDDPGEVSPYASPAIATDLRGLPPAYITTMEFDPLRDEGIIYALRLMEAGVSVELHSYPGTFHGSALMTSAAVSRRGTAEMMIALRRGLHTNDEKPL